MRAGAAVAMGMFLGVALSGCRSADVSGEPAIRYGQETCAECHMLIDDERFAAAWHTPSGERHHFDAVECLFRYLRRHPDATGRIWVHAFDGPQWLNARQAAFVQSREIVTPMGLGVVAVATAEQATQLAQRVNGQVAGFTTVQQTVQE